jgi:hypothetical protein
MITFATTKRELPRRTSGRDVAHAHDLALPSIWDVLAEGGDPSLTGWVRR